MRRPEIPRVPTSIAVRALNIVGTLDENAAKVSALVRQVPASLFHRQRVEGTEEKTKDGKTLLGISTRKIRWGLAGGAALVGVAVYAAAEAQRVPVPSHINLVRPSPTPDLTLSDNVSAQAAIIQNQVAPGAVAASGFEPPQNLLPNVTPTPALRAISPAEATKFVQVDAPQTVTAQAQVKADASGISQTTVVPLETPTPTAVVQPTVPIPADEIAKARVEAESPFVQLPLKPDQPTQSTQQIKVEPTRSAQQSEPSPVSTEVVGQNGSVWNSSDMWLTDFLGSNHSAADTAAVARIVAEDNGVVSQKLGVSKGRISEFAVQPGMTLVFSERAKNVAQELKLKQFRDKNGRR